MNREILFRGKPIDKKFGEWVEGFYMEDLDNGRVKSFIFNPPLQIEVDPETVGQFTGLTDRKGNRIYEGDIFESIYVIAVVEWDKDARFLGFTSQRRILYVGREPKVDIIGNIHDNPSLLK